MRALKIWIGIAMIFILGFASGVIGTVVHIRSVIARVGQSNPEARKTVILKRLVKKLDLTEAQTQKIGVIIEQRDKEMRDAFSQCHPRIRSSLMDALSDIRVELTVEQQETFDKITRRMRKMHSLPIVK